MGVSAIARLLDTASALQSPGAVDFLNRTSFAAGPNSDACPMRFYFGQLPLLVAPGYVTHLLFQNSEPQQARFHFFSPDPSEAVVIKFFKRSANSLEVYANSVQVPTLNTAYAAAGSGAPTYPGFAASHGKSLFNPQARHVTFVMRGQPAWRTSPIDIFTLPSVQLTLTLSISNEQFFDPAKIVSNLATLLGIDPSRIKTVTVAAAGSRQLLRAPAAAAARAAAASGTQVIPLEILPPPGSTYLSQSSSFNTSSPTGSVGIAGSLSDNPSVAASLVASAMVSVASTISSLYASGALSQALGAPIAALTVVAPTVPEVPGLPSPSPSPTVPDSTGAGPARLTPGAIAGLVIGLLLGLVAGAVGGLLLKRKGYCGGRNKSLMAPPPPSMELPQQGQAAPVEERQAAGAGAGHKGFNLRTLMLPQLNTQVGEEQQQQQPAAALPEPLALEQPAQRRRSTVMAAAGAAAVQTARAFMTEGRHPAPLQEGQEEGAPTLPGRLPQVVYKSASQPSTRASQPSTRVLGFQPQQAAQNH